MLRAQHKFSHPMVRTLPSLAKLASAKSECPLVIVGHPFVLTSFSMHPCSPALEGLSQPAHQQLVESRQRHRRSHRRDCRQVGDRGEALTALCNAASCSSGIEGKGCIEGKAFHDEGREICDQGKGIWDEGKGIWTKGKDPILGSEILRSPYDLFQVSAEVPLVFPWSLLVRHTATSRGPSRRRQ